MEYDPVIGRNMGVKEGLEYQLTHQQDDYMGKLMHNKTSETIMVIVTVVFLLFVIILERVKKKQK